MEGRERRLSSLPTDIITTLVAIVSVYYILAFGGKLLEGYRLRRHNVMLRREIATLEEQHEKLEARLKYVQTPDYVEKVAREQYRWVKPGEKLVVTVFRRRSSVGATTRTISPQPEVDIITSWSASYWPEWWKLLAGK